MKHDNFEAAVGLTGCGCLIVVLALKLTVIGGLAYVAYHFIQKVW